MFFSQFIAKQLGSPKGILGILIVGLVVKKRNRVLNDVALHNLQLNSSDRVLEVGFGGGYLMSRISAEVRVINDSDKYRKFVCVTGKK